MGVNLPARNVFIDPERYHRDQYGNWTTPPISQAEYENMSGRAGRLGLEDKFGRAIIVTDSEFQAQVYYEQFVEGELDPIEPALNGDPLDHHVLNLVASKLCRTEEEIRELLLSSYTGETCWRGGKREAEFDKKLSEGLRKCLDGGLIEKADDGLAVTRLGRLAAVKGVRVDTAIAMAKYARENQEVASDLHLLEVLFCLTGTKDGEKVWFNFSTQEYNSGQYHLLMARELASLAPVARERLAWLLDPSMGRYEPTKRIKQTLLLYEWVMGTPTREIEKRFHCFSGSAQGLATEVAWLAETFSAVAKICGWPEETVKQLRNLSEQLLHGVPEAGVEVAAMDVRGLGRGRVMKLIEHGVSTLATIASASGDLLEKLIGKRVAARLLRRVASIQERQQVQKEEPAPEKPNEAEEPANVESTWTDTVPPTDDQGVSYQSTAKIHIDGRADKRRHLVVVDGAEAWLTEQSFEAALKFAVAAKTTQLGWVPCSEYGGSENYRQVVRRLKQDLDAAGVDPETLIENSGAKQYRFSVPPANVAIDAESVAVHFPEGAEVLARLKRGSRP
jgi:helicase